MEFAVTLQQQAMNKPCLGASLVKSSGLGFESLRRKFDSCRMVKTRVQASKIRRERRPQNNDGDYYVDNGCIDCDTCRWMAPRTFKRIDERSAVYSQPNSAEERLKALQALISCPTASIHTESPPDISQVQMLFPLPLDEKSLSGVYLCGYHSDKSHGATSYFIVHPKGNILVGRLVEGKSRYWFSPRQPRHALKLLILIPKEERKAPSYSQRLGQLSPILACQQQNPIKDENGRYSHAFYVMRISSQ